MCRRRKTQVIRIVGRSNPSFADLFGFLTPIERKTKKKNKYFNREFEFSARNKLYFGDTKLTVNFENGLNLSCNI